MSVPTASLPAMSSVEKLLIQHLKDGLPLSVAALGGEDALLADADALAVSPLFDELLVVLCRDWSHLTKQADIEALILKSFGASGSITLSNSLDVIFQFGGVLKEIAKPLAERLLLRLNKRKTELESLVATRALEGLLRLALERLTTKYALLDALTTVQSDETELFAQHAARIIIIAYEQWKDEDLLKALKVLCAIPGATAEANYSLGLAELLRAFEQPTRDAIYERLEAAGKHFCESIFHSEERDDAVAYASVIDVLLYFKDTSQQAAALRAIERLQRAVSMRQMWLYNTHLPSWLTHLVTSEVEWCQLVSKIHAVMKCLEKPGWLKAVSVLPQLFEVYRLSRSVCLNVNMSGLEQLVQPHIEVGFLRSQSHLSVLDEWLQENQDSPEWFDTARLLRSRIKSLSERQNTSALSHPRGGRFPLLAAALDDANLAGITDEQGEQLECLLRTGPLSTDNSSFVCNRIFRNVTAQLVDCPDYVSEVKETFNDLLLRTIHFLANRMDLGKGSAAPNQMYLFEWESGEAAPHEKLLQHDYWNYLVSCYGNKIRVEVSDIASGRVDLELCYAKQRFIAEMKRELSNAEPSNIKKFLGQIAIYEATDVRLGLLLVLDLTDKSKGIPHIEQNVWLEKHAVGSFADTRYVVVFRVPGNRIPPSSTST